MYRFSLLLLLVLAGLSQAADYCSLCKGKHSLCLYDGSINDAVCGKTNELGLKSTVTDAEKTFIVDRHNELRRRIANGEDDVSNMPKAANMMELEWDDELAKIAQGYANQCYYGHDKCRLTSDGCYDGVGQNIAVQGRNKANEPVEWSAAIQMWYDEVKDYDPDWAELYTSPGKNNGVVGHFTQVAWANTHRIGCGYIEFYGSQPLGSNYYNRYYVCNYATGGNWRGQSVYLKGDPCTKCPKNSSCNNSLCKLN